eukprot:scaffold34207_cov34-Prasinocladus_malaysianus.AAC.3
MKILNQCRSKDQAAAEEREHMMGRTTFHKARCIDRPPSLDGAVPAGAEDGVQFRRVREAVDPAAVLLGRSPPQLA